MQRAIVLLVLAAACGLRAPARAEAARPTPSAHKNTAPSLRGPCRTRRGYRALVSPLRPIAGQALRVVVVSERAHPKAQLVRRGPDSQGRTIISSAGGPPFYWIAKIARARSGRYRFTLLDHRGRSLACAHARVRRRKKLDNFVGDAWPVERSWDRSMENLYATWVAVLFDAPAGERPSWTPLHAVLRDPTRNLLYNHLGADEDGPRANKAVVATPDCADLPYYVRAYFAWKLRLPFGYRKCDRGNSRRPARCGPLQTNEGQVLVGAKSTVAKAFSHFLRRKVSYVHSGSGRTAPQDEQSDLYPVALTRQTLRPGTVYVDPYGHLLIIAKWVPQTASASGAMFAVDGHPDLSVGRKRFWKGAFLFSANTRGGAGGFKVFRPLALRDGAVVALTNEELRRSRDFPRVSSQQYSAGDDGFYERMDRVINPRPLSAPDAYRERLKAYYELILERVDSVAAGESYMKDVAYKVVAMPNGPHIFETRGPWEDYSTPARDLRLLIATDEVLGFPSRVIKHPDRFAHSPDSSPLQLKQQLEQLYRHFAETHEIRYIKSDGTEQRLRVIDVVARRKALEMAYNPNDCVEIRWGASGKELASCKRHAPTDQRALMKRFRPWFATRNRPPIR